ncbi:hypothetical protein [Priestia megaterium]|uniref:Uncharacterized protein n=1 Tax=Priestia megaterium TaxID=1404 RepID=A0A6M6DZD0_PRIMG|nr:hypothetical protein [Priestia megaterium]QJX79970.1 hypothetical protein FDZ14_28110 [Priestia megaterium]
MIKIEMLYNGKTIQQFLKEGSPIELISEFKDYLWKIAQFGVKLDGKMLARARYLDERTTDFVINFIELFGDNYPKEIILLLAEQEYNLLDNISERYNLFKYLTQQMIHIQELKNESVYNLFSSALHKNSKQLYGKNVYCGDGSNGREYKGFVNEMYSNNTVQDGVLGVNFELRVNVHTYRVIALGRNLGIDEKTLLELEAENKHTQLLELPKYKKSSISSYWNEQNFKQALSKYCEELGNIVIKEYPGVLVKVGKMYEGQGAKYYINFEKRVEVTNSYEDTRLELIKSIKTLNKVESHYFAFNYMHKDLVESRKERSRKNKPLFVTR